MLAIYLALWYARDIKKTKLRIYECCFHVFLLWFFGGRTFNYYTKYQTNTGHYNYILTEIDTLQHFEFGRTGFAVFFSCHEHINNGLILYNLHFCSFLDGESNCQDTRPARFANSFERKWYKGSIGYSVEACKAENIENQKGNYRTRAIITRSWFETALDYKPQHFLKNYLFLVHK